MRQFNKKDTDKMKRTFGLGMVAVMAFAGTASAQDLIFPPGEDSRFNWTNYEEFSGSMDLSGQEVSVFGPWLTGDKVYVDNLNAYFAAATGATVNYQGSDSFEQQIVIETEAGSPPNIAVFPQPGLAADLAGRGLLSPLGEETADWIRDNYAAGQSWVDLGTYANESGEDQLYGMFYKVDVKSLVWYVPENFEDAGYDIPETMEQLKELTDQIVADGGTPWCIGIGSGGATGWPATDWVEDMMLRTQAPEVYDGWVDNSIKFTDERVINAIDEFGYFARNDDYVAGGVGAVSTSDFRDNPKLMFTSPPGCYMHRQASFIPTFFPEGTEIGVDADFFYFPSYESMDLGRPVLGAGTLVAITSDSEAARAYIEFLKQPIAHEVWMAQKGFLTPHLGVNTETYSDPTLKRLGDILLNATTFRFDGSDLMPGPIGAGQFWTGMVDYTDGKSAEEVAAEIQAVWDGL